MSYIYEIPQIDVLEQKVLYVVPGGQDNVLATDVIKASNDAKHSDILEHVEKVQLLSDAGRRNKNGELLLFKKQNELGNVDNSDVIATMSYKRFGAKIAKQISLSKGLDYFFLYNKMTGFFDREGQLVDSFGEEYSLTDISWKEFYEELVGVLKNRLVLGYLGSSDKDKDDAGFYLNQAHKYIVRDKYNLETSEVLNFVRKIVEKSYFPEKFFDSFIRELDKMIYASELSKADKVFVETMAKMSLFNEKRGMVPFSDVSLHKRALDEIKFKRNGRKINAIMLDEVLDKMR